MQLQAKQRWRAVACGEEFQRKDPEKDLLGLHAAQLVSSAAQYSC